MMMNIAVCVFLRWQLLFKNCHSCNHGHTEDPQLKKMSENEAPLKYFNDSNGRRDRTNIVKVLK